MCRTALAHSDISELQAQYGNYKNALQQLAQKIGDVEQEAEEHKCVLSFSFPCVAKPLSPPPLYRLGVGY